MLLTCFLLSFLLLLFCFTTNGLRSVTPPIKKLSPNRLLTRHPIIFIHGKKSIFYFAKYWNQLPHYLASHGYEIMHLRLPWKNANQRFSALENWIKKYSEANQKFHLVIDNNSLNDLTLLISKESFESIASITCIHDSKESLPEISTDPLLKFKALKHPIEEFIIPKTNDIRSKSFFNFLFIQIIQVGWKIHLLLTNQDLKQKISVRSFGWNEIEFDSFMDRVQELAERDLIHGSSSPTL